VADGSGEAQAIAVGFPKLDRVGGQRFAFPLLLVLGENLDGLALQPFRFQ
jgi:hypothetical protein